MEAQRYELPHTRSPGSNPGSRVRVESRTGLPGTDYFEQQVSQADFDRDPFAIALFEISPAGHDISRVLPRLARTMADFASPSTHVAYLGHGRLAMLARTTDTTHQWVAPIGTALQATLARWLDEPETDGGPRRDDLAVDDDHRPSISDLVGSVDVSDLSDQPRLIAGAARGLSRQVWTNAEAALANARKRQLTFVEYRGIDLGDPKPITGHPVSGPPIERRRQSHRPNGQPMAADDERLVVLSHRIEPVDRPEPEWLWLRLEPGLQLKSRDEVNVIDRTDLSSAERAMLEIWLANQIGPIFADASAQLRVTIPITTEATGARSFAQRIFPLLEQHRIPPSRLVLEIDNAALKTELVTDDAASTNGSQPSLRRFIEDASAMGVSITIKNFDGGWTSWRAVTDLAISYLKPPPAIVRSAGVGDESAERSLEHIATDADDRGIELIVPDVATALSPRDLAQRGFAYHESGLSPVNRAMMSTMPDRARPAQRAGSGRSTP